MSFNNVGKDARANYFSYFVSKNWRNPKVLTLLVILLLLHHLLLWFLRCNTFLSFFVGKINDIRWNIPPSEISCSSWPTIPEIFSPIILQDLNNLTVLNCMKTSSCPAACCAVQNQQLSVIWPCPWSIQTSCYSTSSEENQSLSLLYPKITGPSPSCLL